MPINLFTILQHIIISQVLYLSILIIVKEIDCNHTERDTARDQFCQGNENYLR